MKALEWSAFGNYTMRGIGREERKDEFSRRGLDESIDLRVGA